MQIYQPNKITSLFILILIIGIYIFASGCASAKEEMIQQIKDSLKCKQELSNQLTNIFDELKFEGNYTETITYKNGETVSFSFHKYGNKTAYNINGEQCNVIKNGNLCNYTCKDRSYVSSCPSLFKLPDYVCVYKVENHTNGEKCYFGASSITYNEKNKYAEMVHVKGPEKYLARYFQLCIHNKIVTEYKSQPIGSTLINKLLPEAKDKVNPYGDIQKYTITQVGQNE